MIFEKDYPTFFFNEVESKKYLQKSRQKTFVVFPRETTFVEKFFFETYPQEVLFRPVKNFFTWINLTP